MSSNLSTESPTSTSGNVGTGGTLKDLKTDFANLLINRVTLGECLNVIRDACVARASDLVDEADEPTLGNIRADVETFKSSANTGSGANVGTDANVGTAPTVPLDSSGDAGTEPPPPTYFSPPEEGTEPPAPTYFPPPELTESSGSSGGAGTVPA